MPVTEPKEVFAIRSSCAVMRLPRHCLDDVGRFLLHCFGSGPGKDPKGEGRAAI